MLYIRQTEEFEEWLDGLRDKAGRAIIARRLQRVAAGNLGHVKSIGSGVSELKIDFGPGYRVYFKQRGDAIDVLYGGDKDTQDRDIRRAKELAEKLED
jgi:putative addiction module killer protein